MRKLYSTRVKDQKSIKKFTHWLTSTSYAIHILLLLLFLSCCSFLAIFNSSLSIDRIDDTINRCFLQRKRKSLYLLLLPITFVITVQWLLSHDQSNLGITLFLCIHSTISLLSWTSGRLKQCLRFSVIIIPCSVIITFSQLFNRGILNIHGWFLVLWLGLHYVIRIIVSDYSTVLYVSQYILWGIFNQGFVIKLLIEKAGFILVILTWEHFCALYIELTYLLFIKIILRNPILFNTGIHLVFLSFLF